MHQIRNQCTVKEEVRYEQRNFQFQSIEGERERIANTQPGIWSPQQARLGLCCLSCWDKATSSARLFENLPVLPPLHNRLHSKTIEPVMAINVYCTRPGIHWIPFFMFETLNSCRHKLVCAQIRPSVGKNWSWCALLPNVKNNRKRKFVSSQIRLVHYPVTKCQWRLPFTFRDDAISLTTSTLCSYAHGIVCVLIVECVWTFLCDLLTFVHRSQPRLCVLTLWVIFLLHSLFFWFLCFYSFLW